MVLDLCVRSWAYFIFLVPVLLVFTTGYKETFHHMCCGLQYVVFESLYHTFCCIYTVIVRLYQLYYDVLILQVFLDCLGSYIANDVENCFEASFCKVCDILLESFQRWFILKMFNWFCKDIIRWPVVQHKNVCIFLYWPYWGFSGEVSIDGTVIRI